MARPGRPAGHIFQGSQPTVAMILTLKIRTKYTAGPAGPARPCHSVTLHVTLHWLGYLHRSWRAETTGIDVSQRAESIGEGIRPRGHRYMAQPETTPCHAPVTLLSRSCHAVWRGPNGGWALPIYPHPPNLRLHVAPQASYLLVFMVLCFSEQETLVGCNC